MGFPRLKLLAPMPRPNARKIVRKECDPSSMSADIRHTPWGPPMHTHVTDHSDTSHAGGPQRPSRRDSTSIHGSRGFRNADYSTPAPPAPPAPPPPPPEGRLFSEGWTIRGFRNWGRTGRQSRTRLERTAERRTLSGIPRSLGGVARSCGLTVLGICRVRRFGGG